jgi:hypothetical protein
MKYTLALLSSLSLAAAQGVTAAIAPSAPAPAGCSPSYDGQFEITVATVQNGKRDTMPERRDACGGTGTLVISLNNGILTDAEGRTGYIASNYQFQFDKPPQAGAIYTAGFSICSNGALALGGNETFYQCKSGSFWNLYNADWAAQCSPVEILAMPCGSTATAGEAGQGGDGQVIATTMVTTTIIKPLSDGQPQVITTEVPIAMCQITDGQIQVHTTPCASITGPPVSQYSDGQPQVTTGAPVSEYSDGQPQVTPAGPTVTGPAVSEYSDGQPQVTPAGPTVTGPAVSGSSHTQPALTSSSAAAWVPSASIASTMPGGHNSTIISTVVTPTLTPITSHTTSVPSTVSIASHTTSVPPTVSTAGAGSLSATSLGALVIGLVGAVFAL